MQCKSLYESPVHFAKQMNFVHLQSTYLPSRIIIMIPKTYYGARTQHSVWKPSTLPSTDYYYSPPTPLHSFFELQITPRTFSCSALKQQQQCRPQQSLTTPFCCGHIGTSSVHSRPISGRRSEHKIYLHCWLFRESSIQNNRVSFGCCRRCLMLCRKRDGISI